jgi:hypothetical protein
MAASESRVFLRSALIADSARLTEVTEEPGGATGFLTLAAPPPVGSVVELRSDGAAASHLRVLHVVETTQGVYTVPGALVRAATAAEVARLREIGTEGLASHEGHTSVTQEGSDTGRAAEASALAPVSADAGIPAPVVEPEPSEPIDLPAAEGGAGGESGSGGESDAGGKRRKGRRRS